MNKKQLGVGKKMRSSDIYLQSQILHLTKRPFSTYFQLKIKTSKRLQRPPSLEIFVQIINKQLRLYMPQNSTLISLLTAMNWIGLITFLHPCFLIWEKNLQKSTLTSMAEIHFILFLKEKYRPGLQQRPEIRTGWQ